MTERGIIFNAEMVRAVLDGSKTQTRRIMKVQPHAGIRNSVFVKSGFEDGHGKELVCPFGAVGDRLWVRETWARYNIDQNSHDMAYRATTPDDWPKEGRWRPSIHMPRWASRITLEITGVRVERLNDISEDDAKAEGAPTECCVMGDKHFLGFRSLWRSIYGANSWQANPWVWVIEFKRVEGSDAETQNHC
ncbi:morphogenetic protein [Pantoea dispersa]